MKRCFKVKYWLHYEYDVRQEQRSKHRDPSTSSDQFRDQRPEGPQSPVIHKLWTLTALTVIISIWCMKYKHIYRFFDLQTRYLDCSDGVNELFLVSLRFPAFTTIWRSAEELKYDSQQIFCRWIKTLISLNWACPSTPELSALWDHFGENELMLKFNLNFSPATVCVRAVVSQRHIKHQIWTIIKNWSLVPLNEASETTSVCLWFEISGAQPEHTPSNTFYIFISKSFLSVAPQRSSQTIWSFGVKQRDLFSYRITSVQNLLLASVFLFSGSSREILWNDSEGEWFHRKYGFQTKTLRKNMTDSLSAWFRLETRAGVLHSWM